MIPAYYYGAILPSAKIFGGVKRFLELGNEFVSMGIGFVIFTPDGKRPAWFNYNGEIKSFASINEYEFEALFITESQFIPQLLGSNSKLKVFYFVTSRFVLRKPIRAKQLRIFVNSTTTNLIARRFYRITPFVAIGGVNTELFKPKPFQTSEAAERPLTILTYGRLTRKKKGTSIVVKACERLYQKGLNIKLILFDSPIDDEARKGINDFQCRVPFEFIVDHPVMENCAMFHLADIFVSAEKGGGWSNTSAEAAASGIPVIATRNGTRDFIIHDETGIVVRRSSRSIQRAISRLYQDPVLRQTFAEAARKKIEQFSWKKLAEKIDNYCRPA